MSNVVNESLIRDVVQEVLSRLQGATGSAPAPAAASGCKCTAMSGLLRSLRLGETVIWPALSLPYESMNAVLQSLAQYD